MCRIVLILIFIGHSNVFSQIKLSLQNSSGSVFEKNLNVFLNSLENKKLNSLSTICTREAISDLNLLFSNKSVKIKQINTSMILVRDLSGGVSVRNIHIQYSD